MQQSKKPKRQPPLKTTCYSWRAMGRITAADAEAEDPADRLFAEETDRRRDDAAHDDRVIRRNSRFL